jgi:hypothetical protein
MKVTGLSKRQEPPLGTLKTTFELQKNHDKYNGIFKFYYSIFSNTYLCNCEVTHFFHNIRGNKAVVWKNGLDEWQPTLETRISTTHTYFIKLVVKCLYILK